jgi:hypothetical protein
MSSALYAISYRQTGGVVALCSFEQQELPDPPAAAALLGRLVGARLPLSLSTSGAPLAIPASELACDRVKPPSRQDLDAALAEPYLFRVGLEADAAALPPLGDGKEKALRKANRYFVSSVALTAEPSASARVQVTLSSQQPDTLAAVLLFEGHDPVTKTSQATVKGVTQLVFALPADVEISPGASYGMVLLMEGAPVEARSVQASRGGSGGGGGGGGGGSGGGGGGAPPLSTDQPGPSGPSAASAPAEGGATRTAGVNAPPRSASTEGGIARTAPVEGGVSAARTVLVEGGVAPSRSAASASSGAAPPPAGSALPPAAALISPKGAE